MRDGAVSVRDHGPGVDPGDLPHIFDRFYRSPAARTMPGYGFGLAIVKQVAESHGGDVSAGPAPGGGAFFVLQQVAFPNGQSAARSGSAGICGRQPSPLRLRCRHSRALASTQAVAVAALVVDADLVEARSSYAGLQLLS